MQESDIKAGDAIFFNTGWGSLWMKNNDRLNSGEPGIGLEVARWVIEKDLCLTAADTWAVEVVPMGHECSWGRASQSELADEAVTYEPVSGLKFPANREKNREFGNSERRFGLSSIR